MSDSFKPGAARSASIPDIRRRNSMEPRLSIITLGVADLERSVRFYRDGLGLPRRESAPEIAFFTTRGTWLALYGRKELAEDAGVPPAGNGFPGFALAHNVRSREEVDRVIATAQAAGARVTSPAQDRFWGGYSGYFADPDGFLWEVAFAPDLHIE
jgi:catechol 2,3-dioxygenase-like lactoylglutathione lyase family enzyme